MGDFDFIATAPIGRCCRAVQRSVREKAANADEARFALVAAWVLNGPRHGVCDGDIAWMDDDLRPGDQSVSLFRVSESCGSAGGVSFLLASFEEMPETGGAGDGPELGFGYALTVHKAQGTEWSSVSLYDEMLADNPDHARWTCTGTTRASQRIVDVNSRCK